MIPLRSRHVLLCVLLALLALLVLPAAAQAHAVLETTTPADGARLDAAPEAVRLDFSEPVTASPGAVRVFDSAGERVDSGAAIADDEPDRLAVGLSDGLGDGTYIVTWRAVSADDHPVSGAFVFTVGQEAPVDDDVVAAIFAQAAGDDRLLGAAAVVLRALMYSGVLLAAGGVAFLVFVYAGADVERRLLLRLVLAAAAVAALATVGGVALQAALVTGLGVAAMLDPTVLAQVATSSYGIAAGVRLLGLVLLLAGPQQELRMPAMTLSTRQGSRTRWWSGGTYAAGAGGGLCLVSFVLTGHPVTGEPRWLMTLADLSHTFAASVWSGGLVLLLVTLRRRRGANDPVGGGELVARYSSLAALALLGVVVAGGVMAWVQVRAPRGLTTTAYGWTLLSKLAVAGAVIAVGAYNKRRLVPAVLRGGERAWRRLRSLVAWEVAGLAAVVAVTAVLVNLVPAREAAGITGPYSTTVALGSRYQLTVTVDPNRAGTNEVHLYTLGADGRPADLADLTLAFTQPARDIAPINRDPEHVGPGHWQLIGPELSISGQWQLHVTARVSDFEEQSATIAVPVN